MMSREDEDQWFISLTSWIYANGGFVHAELGWKIDADQNHCGRCIVSQRDISKGDVLVKLPQNLAVCGNSLPSQYEWREDDSQSDKTFQRHASAWLRCIASLMQGFERKVPSEYLNSLPVKYDTLLSETWTDDQIKSFLSGTTLGSMVLKDRISDALRTRFMQSVLPYLKFNNIMTSKSFNEEDIFQYFVLASQCISTRGFHLKCDQTSSTDENAYEGPYLLPFIDLLNHTSDPKKICTTLHQSQGSFVMVAERFIAAGEEIVHSYGSNTSASLLQTFGFVDEYLINRAASGVLSSSSPSSDNCDGTFEDITPAFLSKDNLIEICNLVSVSNVPDQLIHFVENEYSLKDFDIWDLPSKDDLQKRNEGELKKQFTEEIIVDYRNPLSDDIITICCTQFLPDDAYDEICTLRHDGERSICKLSTDILEDYFLGSLVIISLMTCIKKKLNTYVALVDCIERLNLLSKRCREGGANNTQDIHEMYSLTISIEEQSCLMHLMRQCTTFRDQLQLYDDSSNKRFKHS